MSEIHWIVGNQKNLGRSGIDRCGSPAEAGWGTFRGGADHRLKSVANTSWLKRA